LETCQDVLNGMEGGFQQQEGIFLRAPTHQLAGMAPILDAAPQNGKTCTDPLEGPDTKC
jgi:hypothetical protein